jgi:hypothetical protein
MLQKLNVTALIPPQQAIAAAWGFAAGLLLFSIMSYQINPHPLYLITTGVGVAAVGIWALAMAYTMPRPAPQLTNQPTTGGLENGINTGT